MTDDPTPGGPAYLVAQRAELLRFAQGAKCARGFGYLDALREVFSRSGPHHDAVPTAGQKRRFNVLFPQE